MPGARIGVALSGGADSVALLLLAAQARPDQVEAATVDHGLRVESGDEAARAETICDRIGVSHSTLRLQWNQPPAANLQSMARERRYQALAVWAAGRGLQAVATGHHANDQAETLLMRLARGAGVGGLGGIRPSRALGSGVELIRPLLHWRRHELAAIVAQAGVIPVDDPSNRDSRFNRTAARDLLHGTHWLAPERLAAAASHCRDATEALDWATHRELELRRHREGEVLTIEPSGLPREIKRRLLKAALLELGAAEPPGPELVRALDRLEAGEVMTLAGIKLEGGDVWRLRPAPPRSR